MLGALRISQSSTLMFVVTWTEFKQGCQVFFFKAILNNLRKDRNYRLKTNCSFVRLTVFVDGGLLVFLFTVGDHVPRLILAGFKCNLYITLNLKNKFCYIILFDSFNNHEK